MHKGLVTFACFNSVGFLSNILALFHKMETLPGLKHLLSLHCQMPAAEIARFVRQQEHHFQARLEARMPGSASLLLPVEEGSWPIALPLDATVDLCSPAWALGNAYLLVSSVLVLLMHAHVVRMLR